MKVVRTLSIPLLSCLLLSGAESCVLDAAPLERRLVNLPSNSSAERADESTRRSEEEDERILMKNSLSSSLRLEDFLVRAKEILQRRRGK